MKGTVALTIRARTILIVLPVLIAAVLITGAVTMLAAASGVTRIAMRLMSFKSEELSNYMYGQWDLLVRNQFADRPEFVQAAQYSIDSFARTLVHDDSEMIFAIDASGEVVMTTAPLELSDPERSRLVELGTIGAPGWTEVRAGGIPRVGELTFFAPFEWTVLVTDRSEGFYREVRVIIVQGLVILLVCSIAAVLLLLTFSRYLTRPLSSVVSTIEGIIANGDFSRQVEVEHADEIGHLAGRFNLMTASLLSSYNQVKDHAYKEAVARRQVVQREYETLIVLGKAAEFKDPQTGTHIARVGYYSRMLARLIGEDAGNQDIVFYASPMHDIGKLGIPDSILLKPGKLTTEEFEIIKQHTTIAFQILKDSRSPYLRAGAEIALTHHEWFDGTGYPEGLAGSAIPLFGRIVGLADAFDAVTSERPYKGAWDLDLAFAMLVEEKGTHFDPRLVELFHDQRDEVEEIYATHRNG
jgi:response regulator RpfG family c-di-GMP phosphodiesterase